MRRCKEDSCIASATARSVNLDLPIATVLVRPQQEWKKITAGKVKVARTIDVDWKTYNSDNYLFSHSTIVASVDVEKNGYHIKPACSELVNNNGNAWSNPVLLSTFRTFVGAENYLEHLQIPELSKGKILDAVIRPVRYKSRNGEEADVYYVDILVATNRRHDSLVRKIASGELTTMSMGCLADWVQCSHCGMEIGDGMQDCSHLSHEILKPFTDENGVERMTAELCGRIIEKDGSMVGDPESVKFIEASWVENPAFKGAVLNHYVLEPNIPELENLNTARLAEVVEDLGKLRVADETGMAALRVARDVLRRRRKQDMTDRILGRFL